MIKKTIAMMTIIATLGTGIVHSEVNQQNNNNTENAIQIEALTVKDKFLSVTNQVLEAVEIERCKIQEQINIKQEEINTVINNNTRKNKVSFNPYNLTQKSGITGNELYNVLLGFSNGSLANYAWVFVDCENTYNVNALFLASLVAQESGWGNSYRAKYQNNLTGHAVYNSSAAGSTFSSKEESIYSTAKMLKNNYLSISGKQYKGVSIWNVNTSYCLTEDSSAPDYKWSDSISSIANDLCSYYHNKIKKLEIVPEMDINMDELLNQKKQEIINTFLRLESSFE